MQAQPVRFIQVVLAGANAPFAVLANIYLHIPCIRCHAVIPVGTPPTTTTRNEIQCCVNLLHIIAMHAQVLTNFDAYNYSVCSSLVNPWIPFAGI